MKENLQPNTQNQQVEKRADMSIQKVLAELCRAKTQQRVKSVTMTKENTAEASAFREHPGGKAQTLHLSGLQPHNESIT